MEFNLNEQRCLYNGQFHEVQLHRHGMVFPPSPAKNERLRTCQHAATLLLHYRGNYNESVKELNNTVFALLFTSIMDTVSVLGVTLVPCWSSSWLRLQTKKGGNHELIPTTRGICVLAGLLLQLPFHQFHTATPSCGFYYYLVLSLLQLLILV